jgi:hypothetical protein
MRSRCFERANAREALWWPDHLPAIGAADQFADWGHGATLGQVANKYSER